MVQMAVAVLTVLEIFSAAAMAQTSRNELINNVMITDQKECALIRVEFELPVKYKKHFPESAGKELRVYIDPVISTAEDRQLIERNEYISPPDSDIVAIGEIIYEGADVVEPYLTIYFDHPMQFQVKQGTDFRSVLIAVYLPSSTGQCLP